MKIPAALIALMILTASPAFAKPRTKMYAASCGRIWEVVQAVAAEKEYSSSMLDDARHKAQLVTGHGFWTGKRTVYVTLTGSGDTCDVAVEGVFSGLAHNDKGDLFKRIDDSLLKPPSSAESAH